MNRIMLVAAVIFCLAGCSVNQQKVAEPPAGPADSALRQQLQQTLPGLYGNYAQHWASRENPDQSSAPDHWRVAVTVLRTTPGAAWFSLLQYPANDANKGRTMLMQFTFGPENAVLRFSPYSSPAAPRELNAEQLAAAARFIPGCEVRLSWRAGVLAGQTSPANCRLAGKDGVMFSLVKDFAFSANSIAIADRLVDPATGGSIGDDRVFRFSRMQQYRGWAGIKPDGTKDWQLARPLEIWSDGGTAQLVDLSGTAMGYRIRLARVPWRTDQDAILRLDLVDIDSGEIVAYSWADTTAKSVGINLGWIQVGLSQILP